MDELEKTAQETAEETGGMAPDAGEQQVPAGEQGVPGGEEDFETLIRGRYKGRIRRTGAADTGRAAAGTAAGEREAAGDGGRGGDGAAAGAGGAATGRDGIRGDPARQQMAQAIASGGSRVAENGGRRRSVSRWDPRGLSGAELAAIRKRVQDGEKIRF